MAEFVSIIIPCFNEDGGISATIDTVCSHMSEHHSDVEFEFILVNDGSSDQTEKYINEAANKYPQVKSYSLKENMGRGAAIKKGLTLSKGTQVVLLDADLSYDAQHITDILRTFREQKKVDVVVVSPYMKGGKVGGVPFSRYLLSRTANWVLAGIFSQKLSTVTCVVRGYRGDLIRNIPLFEEGKELHLEILRKMSIIDANIVEIPGRLIWKIEKGQKRRAPNLRFVKSARSHLLFGLLARPTKLFNAIAIFLFSIGIYESVVLLRVFFQHYQSHDNFWRGVWIGLSGSFNQSPHTVVIASVFLILGMQALSFISLFLLLKLQQDEVIRHLIAVLDKNKQSKS